ncbi:hypothetical protein EYC80_003280 [Monilinia laxa]|nr:hypothetical protein EYC80_003280 [Monilinia laxa]
MHNTIIDNKLREVQREPIIERQSDYTTKVEWRPGSVLNKVTDISKSALALQRIRNAPGTIAGQHFRRHDRAKLIKGRNLADMVMDLEDLNKKRERTLQKPLQGGEKMQRQRNEAIEKTEKEARRITHMKLVERRFTTEHGRGRKLDIGEDEINKEVKREVEDEWQEDYV